ncbi:MAG: M66 family metalloprotease [Gemmatimonadota bacterium]|nr:M66 family metalloprotease [Gemmatimonadota bacterium]
MRVRKSPTIRCLTTSYGHHAIRHRIASDDTCRVPPELGNLTNLTHLYLGRNQLTGSIPPELGNLASLELLDLLSNQVEGPLPPELGQMAALEHLILSRNRRLEGELPRELTALALDELQLGATRLCAPADDEFRAWVASIGTGWAPLCADERTHAYLTQASQSASVPVKLVAGEQALLRVFVVANTGVSASFPAVRARFFDDGREVHSVSLPASTRSLPTAVDESSLDASANALIPGSVLVPGLEMVVEIDPEGALPAGTGVPRRWPEEGRAALDVRRMRPLDLTLVPFLYNSNPDQGLANDVKAVRAQDALFDLTRDLLPVEEFTVTAREPVWTSIDPVFANSSALLRETWATRTMDGATGYYMGIMRGGGGRGYVGWPGSVSGLRGPTIAHELGHNMSLRHAPCGDPSNIELIYPYVNGSIGSWGYDFVQGILVSPTRPDFMSYCGPEWVSDYSFNKALHFRETLEPERAGSRASAAATAHGLLLWGGQGADSVPILEPAFVVRAPPSLPREEGPFRLAGLTTREDTLFSFSFAMAETGEGDGESAFAFVLPTQRSWADSLDRIVLIGPGGSDAVGRGDPLGQPDTAGGESGGAGQQSSGRASVLLIDGASGRARGFLRDSPGQPLTLPTTSLRLPEPGLEAVVSRGVPDSAAWRR